MNSPDWHELLRGVEELGHGAIVFIDRDAEVRTVAEVVVTEDGVGVILE